MVWTLVTTLPWPSTVELDPGVVSSVKDRFAALSVKSPLKVLRPPPPSQVATSAEPVTLSWSSPAPVRRFSCWMLAMASTSPVTVSCSEPGLALSIVTMIASAAADQSAFSVSTPPPPSTEVTPSPRVTSKDSSPGPPVRMVMTRLRA